MCLLPCILIISGNPTTPAIPLTTIAGDNVELTSSDHFHIAPKPIADTDANGVIHIREGGLVLDFGGQTLTGADLTKPPDQRSGIGIDVAAANVTIRNLTIKGFKHGIRALHAPGLTLENVTIIDGFAQHLKSTPHAEDGSDWLWPHQNDQDEWAGNYGAAVWLKDASGITLNGVIVRRCQNGIILDRVTDSRIFDCDCSFLSGWGLAMWRSSNNVITRNAFDFCIRGYSHGVYNRGQDSAGVLLFEQCCNNVFAENSITHGGDGIFGFAGKEALGEQPPPPAAEPKPAATPSSKAADIICVSPPNRKPIADTNPNSSHYRRGCNDNLFLGNDLSSAAAHGLELTFSFGNRILGNTFSDNAICGIWGGYSQDTIIAGNTFASNGAMAYGLERGGINMEHAVNNRIIDNSFSDNACGVHLWWRMNRDLEDSRWGQANSTACERNVIARNSFSRDQLAIQLRDAGENYILQNAYSRVPTPMEPASAGLFNRSHFEALGPDVLESTEAPELAVPGVTQPVGARAKQAGREHIVMTDWFPYDWESPLLRPASMTSAGHEYELLGTAVAEGMHIKSELPITLEAADQRIRLIPAGDRGGPNAGSYTLTVDTAAGPTSISGFMLPIDWTIRVFPTSFDPRIDDEAFRSAAAAAPAIHRDSLRLTFGMQGPAEALRRGADSPGDSGQPLPGADHFGLTASAPLRLPRGRYALHIRSDDGVRARLDDQPLLTNWTWHAPTTDTAEFEITDAAEHTLSVDYFELDGFAVLEVEIEPVVDRSSAQH